MGSNQFRLEFIPFIEGDHVHVQRVVAGKLDHHKVMLDWVTSLGQQLQFYIRDQLVLLVNDPVLVERVLLKAKMKIPQNNKLMTSLHSPELTKHIGVLRNCFPASYNKFKDSGKLEMLLDRLRGVLNKYVDSGEPLPLWDIFGSFALDYVYNMLFGIDRNFLENMDEYKELRETIEYLFDNFEHSPSALKEFWSRGEYLDLAGKAPQSALFVYLWRFCLRGHCKALLQEMRDTHGFASDADPTFAPIFLKYAKEHDWEEDQILQELAVFMLAGHETTANAMCFLVYELARNDGLQEQCRAIVHPDFDLSVPRPAFELEHVIDESMRIHPVVSRAMLRTSDEDFPLNLGGGFSMTVPHGVGILVNFYALHNSPLNWQDPDVFDPTRHTKLPPRQQLFADGTRRGERRQEGVRFCPFSFGVRSCPGEGTAKKEIKHVLEVFSEYKFAFAALDDKFKPRHLSQLSNVTMRLSKDVKILVTRLIVPPPKKDSIDRNHEKVSAEQTACAGPDHSLKTQSARASPCENLCAGESTSGLASINSMESYPAESECYCPYDHRTGQSASSWSFHPPTHQLYAGENEESVCPYGLPKEDSEDSMDHLNPHKNNAERNVSTCPFHRYADDNVHTITGAWALSRNQ